MKNKKITAPDLPVIPHTPEVTTPDEKAPAIPPATREIGHTEESADPANENLAQAQQLHVLAPTYNPTDKDQHPAA